MNALQWAIGEMERRYKLLEAVHVRDLPAYQELCRDGYQKVEIDERTGSAREVDLEPLPFIVIVIDELAEIMVAYGKKWNRKSSVWRRCRGRSESISFWRHSGRASR